MNLEDLYRLLRSEHVQAQGIVDTLEESLLVLDHSSCVLTANRGFYETFRVSRDDTVGRNLFDLGNGQWNIPELRRLVSEIIPRSAAVVGYEVTAKFPTIGQRTMLVSARRLVHPDNNSTSILMLFEDVTDSRKSEAQKDILLAETRHRMKNLLAIVRSLATQTDVAGHSAKEYRDAFLGRLQALTEAETLGLASSAEANLSAGPPLRLKPSQVVPMSLILHELATNAWKYGALSKPEGLVNLSWRTSEEQGKTVLHMDWREENGPPVTRPTRFGFGSRLIDLSAVQGLRGAVELKYEPTGLRVVLTAPVE
jgi:two-component sensor histidine kinase